MASPITSELAVVTTIRCYACKQQVDVSLFYRNKAKSRGYTTECIPCQKAADNTLDRYLFNLWRESKHSSQKRSQNGRRLAAHTLTREQVRRMWDNQAGLCFYTGLLMFHIRNHSWQASLERLDPSLDYSEANCVLVVWEMNGSTQWTTAKRLQFLEEIAAPEADMEAFRQLLQQPEPECTRSSLKGRVVLPSTQTGEGVNLYHCSVCNLDKPRDAFEKGQLRRQCIACRLIEKERVRATPRGYVGTLLSAAKQRSKVRAAVQSRVGDSTFTLTLEEALDVLLFQNGNCAYSKIRLRFGTNQQWCASLERIDNRRGYHKDNICWVCHEFNVSARVVDQPDGTAKVVGGWTSEKVELMTASLRAKLAMEQTQQAMSTLRISSTPSIDDPVE